MKRCPRCKQDKETSEFFISRKSRSKDGLHNICKQCSREYGKSWYKNNIHKNGIVLKDSTHITAEDYLKLLKDQNGKCAICKFKPENGDNRLAVDHDHGTKKVRGLLCSKCNTALGLFKDDVEILDEAISYLKK